MQPGPLGNKELRCERQIIMVTTLCHSDRIPRFSQGFCLSNDVDSTGLLTVTPATTEGIPLPAAFLVTKNKRKTNGAHLFFNG
jgi:hypothetical protein